MTTTTSTTLSTMRPAATVRPATHRRGSKLPQAHAPRTLPALAEVAVGGTKRKQKKKVKRDLWNAAQKCKSLQAKEAPVYPSWSQTSGGRGARVLYFGTSLAERCCAPSPSSRVAFIISVHLDGGLSLDALRQFFRRSSSSRWPPHTLCAPSSSSSSTERSKNCEGALTKL